MFVYEIVARLYLISDNVNQQDYNGFTGLMWATERGKVEAVKLLVELGADVSLRSTERLSALDIAKRNGNQTLADILIAAAAFTSYNDDLENNTEEGQGRSAEGQMTSSCFSPVSWCEGEKTSSDVNLYESSSELYVTASSSINQSDSDDPVIANAADLTPPIINEQAPIVNVDTSVSLDSTVLTPPIADEQINDDVSITSNTPPIFDDDLSDSSVLTPPNGNQQIIDVLSITSVSSVLSRPTLNGSVVENASLMADSPLVTPPTSALLFENNLSVRSLTPPTSSQNSAEAVLNCCSELELFLVGLDLCHLVQLFADKGVTFSSLLKINDDELFKIGVMEPAQRRAIIDAVRLMHRQSWQSPALPSVTYEKKITCAEGVLMLSNVKNQLTYTVGVLGYVSDQINAHKQIVLDAPEGCSALDVMSRCGEAMTSVSRLYDELVQLRQRMGEIRQDQDRYTPPPLLPRRASKNKNKINKYRFAAAGLACAYAGILAYVLMK